MKKNKSENLKTGSLGITLIALVITIVILLILAGVSIGLIVSENGIMKRASEGKEKYGQAAANEARDLNTVESWLGEQFGEGSGGGADLPSEADVTTPYFPSTVSGDFTKVDGTDLSNGLTIQDKAGNQYVWVEVPKTLYNENTYNANGTKKPNSDTDYDNIEYCLHQYAMTYRQEKVYNSDGTIGNAETKNEDIYCEDSTSGWFTETQYNDQKKKMLKSVYDNGGFWVARYEAGIEINRTTNITPTEAPLSKENLYPYTYVTRTQAKVLAEKVKYGDYKGSLMFGVQWDLILAFLHNQGNISDDLLTKDSSSIGNYSGWGDPTPVNRGKYSGAIKSDDPYGMMYGTSWEVYTKLPVDDNGNYIAHALLTTGASDRNKTMNIYDLAGNVIEWKLEKNYRTDNPYYCTARGGGIGNSGTEDNGQLNERYGLAVTEMYFNAHGIGGFRVSLY